MYIYTCAFICVQVCAALFTFLCSISAKCFTRTTESTSATNNGMRKNSHWHHLCMGIHMNMYVYIHMYKYGRWRRCSQRTRAVAYSAFGRLCDIPECICATLYVFRYSCNQNLMHMKSNASTFAFIKYLTKIC